MDTRTRLLIVLTDDKHILQNWLRGAISTGAVHVSAGFENTANEDYANSLSPPQAGQAYAVTVGPKNDH